MDDDDYEIVETLEGGEDGEKQGDIDEDGEDDMGTEEIEDDSTVTFAMHAEPVFCVDILRDSGVVVSGGQDEWVSLWDSSLPSSSDAGCEDGGQSLLIARLEGHQDSVINTLFHPLSSASSSSSSSSTTSPSSSAAAAPFPLLLATADMLGHIQVWSVADNGSSDVSSDITSSSSSVNSSSGLVEKVWSYECGSDLELIHWHPKAPVLFAGLASGFVYMLKVDTKNSSSSSSSEQMKCYPGNGSAVSAITLTHSGLDMVVGYSNGVVKTFNLKSCDVISSINLCSASNHNRAEDGGVEFPITKLEMASVKSSSAASSTTDSDNCRCFASTYKSVSLLNLKTGKVLTQIGKAIEGTHFNPNRPSQQDGAGGDAEMGEGEEGEGETVEIETFAQCPSTALSLVCLGRNNGSLETWDINTGGMRSMVRVKGAVTRIVFPNVTVDQPVAIVSTSSGTCYCFDALTNTLLRTIHGHRGAVLDCKLSSDDTFFVTSSEDTTVKLFHLS